MSETTSHKRQKPPRPKKNKSPEPYPLPSLNADKGKGKDEPIEEVDREQWLEGFWQHTLENIEKIPEDDTEFRNPALPLARIKKVMKSDPEVQMVATEGPLLMSKSCEIFITEVTCRAYLICNAGKRKTITQDDIVAAVKSSEIFDFLVDILPREKIEDGVEGELGSTQDPTGEEDRPHKRPRLEGDEVEDEVNVDEGSRPAVDPQLLTSLAQQQREIERSARAAAKNAIGGEGSSGKSIEAGIGIPFGVTSGFLNIPED